jgi:hypothetical protein
MVTAWVFAASCGGGPASPSRAVENLMPRLDTAHFHLLAGGAPDSVLRGVADALEEARPRLLADLAAPATRSTTVRIWQDESSFLAALEAALGQRFSASGYITGPDEIRLLAVPRVERNATHEFVHAASLYLNPSFANNPRWLWETVALYENGEFVDPKTLPYLTGRAFPTLAQLNADPNASQRIYDLGFVLGEFIVSRVGPEGLIEMIRSNGDTTAVMGLSAAQFEAALAAFITARYLD